MEREAENARRMERQKDASGKRDQLGKYNPNSMEGVVFKDGSRREER